jgi:hypothetical protein
MIVMHGGEGCRTGHSVGSWPVFDHNSAAPSSGEMLSEYAGRDIGRTSRCNGNDDPNWSLRPKLRSGGRHRQSQCSQGNNEGGLWPDYHATHGRLL